jgi:hypothetical protein
LAGRTACSLALQPPRPTAAFLAANRLQSRFRPNRPHQSTEGESKPHPSRRSLALPPRRPDLLRRRGPPCEDWNLSQGLSIRTGGLSVKGFLNPRFKILNLVHYIVNGRKNLKNANSTVLESLLRNLTFLEKKFSNFSLVFKWIWIDQFE